LFYPSFSKFQAKTKKSPCGAGRKNARKKRILLAVSSNAQETYIQNIRLTGLPTLGAAAPRLR
jgi:hypothetical protein